MGTAGQRVVGALGYLSSALVAAAKWLGIRGGLGAALLVGSFLVLRYWPNDPSPRDFPDGKPSIGILVDADDDREVTVVGSYAVEDDLLIIEVNTCAGHDRLVVSFANVPYRIVENASAAWRAGADTTDITPKPVEWDDGQSAVLLRAPSNDPGCSVFAVHLTGMDLASSRGGKTVVVTPRVIGCGAPAQGEPVDGDAVRLDDIDGSWRPECTEGVVLHPVRIDQRPGQWVVKAEPLPPNPQHPYEFTGAAQVILADDGDVRDREVVDELLIAVMGAGVALLIEVGLRNAKREREAAATG